MAAGKYERPKLRTVRAVGENRCGCKRTRKQSEKTHTDIPTAQLNNKLTPSRAFSARFSNYLYFSVDLCTTVFHRHDWVCSKEKTLSSFCLWPVHIYVHGIVFYSIISEQYSFWETFVVFVTFFMKLIVSVDIKFGWKMWKFIVCSLWLPHTSIWVWLVKLVS